MILTSLKQFHINQPAAAPDNSFKISNLEELIPDSFWEDRYKSVYETLDEVPIDWPILVAQISGIATFNKDLLPAAIFVDEMRLNFIAGMHQESRFDTQIHIAMILKIIYGLTFSELGFEHEHIDVMKSSLQLDANNAIRTGFYSILLSNSANLQVLLPNEDIAGLIRPEIKGGILNAIPSEFAFQAGFMSILEKLVYIRILWQDEFATLPIVQHMWANMADIMSIHVNSLSDSATEGFKITAFLKAIFCSRLTLEPWKMDFDEVIDSMQSLPPQLIINSTP